MRQYDQILVDIVQYVYHYNIKEEKSFERARLLLLDSLGCAVESLSDVSIRRIIGPHVPGTIVPDGFQLPGTDLQLDPVKGTFDLGTMIRYLDHNDALGGGRVQPPIGQPWCYYSCDGLARPFITGSAIRSQRSPSEYTNPSSGYDQSL